MTRFSDLIAGLPPFHVEHYGAADGGHVCLISCEVERGVNEVQDFCERHTGLSGWLMELNYPKIRDGRYYWRAIRR